MDDNARPDRAKIVDECLQSEDITRMDWPTYSPDLNAIEQVFTSLEYVDARRKKNHVRKEAKCVMPVWK
ncbi:hypothetical protein TNCV_3636991 [Trichonephila clavipes]|nr:hypothetical protein TNCV_3636991 [Trichonephila clavipes]